VDPVNKSITKTDQRCSPAAGFTLVELMVALAVSGIVMAAVTTAFLSQHNVYLTQGQVVEMQENARVAMNMLEMDLRSAGYDPKNRGGAGIIAPGANTITFTRYTDLPGPPVDLGGGPLETITYSLVDAFVTEGRNDGFLDDLGRRVDAGVFEPVVENISWRVVAAPFHLELRYLDVNGVATAVLSDIRSIQVSFLAQSAQRASTSSHPSRDTYTTPSGANWLADANFWNLYMTTTINCRNLGL
jgi:type IV pilus assembly protein PilW